MEDINTLRKLKTFYSLLKEYRDVYGKSLDDIIPDYPIKNHSLLEEKEEKLASLLAILNPVISKYSSGREMASPYFSGTADIYGNAIANNIAIWKGKFIHAALQDLIMIIALLDNNIKENKKNYTPEERNYWYEDKQLKFRLKDGSTDQFDFSKAEISRKIFETFWYLWKSEGKGEYSKEEIIKKYKNLFKEELLNTKISEIVSNIRASIINPKETINNRIIWKFNKQKTLWIFKIL